MADIHPSRLYARNITVGYAQAEVLKDVDVTIPNGQITAVVGANGCGKSTLLRALARLIQPTGGTIHLDGKPIASMTSKSVAQQLAFLPQNPVSPDGLTVRQLCRFGRHPHKGFLSPLTKDDDKLVEQALAATGLIDFAERQLDQLSGGQRQRAWIAMALVQETPLLLLDEPTTYLDIAHQLEVLELLKKLNQERGRTIVMVVHDLNHAALYAHHLIAISEGRVYASGSPAQLLTPKLVKDVFGIEALVVPHPLYETPYCFPIAAR